MSGKSVEDVRRQCLDAFECLKKQGIVIEYKPTRHGVIFQIGDAQRVVIDCGTEEEIEKRRKFSEGYGNIFLYLSDISELFDFLKDNYGIENMEGDRGHNAIAMPAGNTGQARKDRN